jgi:hypothetical protein
MGLNSTFASGDVKLTDPQKSLCQGGVGGDGLGAIGEHRREASLVIRRPGSHCLKMVTLYASHW